MFLKQHTYKPRSNSTSSQGSQTGLSSSPPKDDAAKVAGSTGGPTANAAAAGRRRSSASGADKFAGLSAYKRSSQDTDAAAKKASWAEQKPGQQGILGGMWNSFTKGDGK